MAREKLSQSFVEQILSGFGLWHTTSPHSNSCVRAAQNSWVEFVCQRHPLRRGGDKNKVKQVLQANYLEVSYVFIANQSYPAWHLKFPILSSPGSAKRSRGK